MEPASKKHRIDKEKETVLKTQKSISLAITKIKQLIDAKISSAKVEDRWTNAAVKAMNIYRLTQLEILKDSPFFNKCDTEFNGNLKTFYFGKFTFPEENIFSWVSPIASIRFDNPGNTSYTLPSGEKRIGTMTLKDSYQIIDGKIVFYSTESISLPRELIYQENFTLKQGFLLPEIVSQMEKAQDTIIRAHHKGPFLISGPAGSGKTTLALHRIAYLFQAPHTADIYKDQSIVVFVQDQKSKDYFSHLLPELGIKTVQIRTFTEWALEILDIEIQGVSSYCHDLYYEYQKIQALRKAMENKKLPSLSDKPFPFLQKIYFKEMSKENGMLFKKQQEAGVVDRIDLTFMLLAHREKFKKLNITRVTYDFDAQDNFVPKKKRVPLDYALMMVDEFQNYLPEQISIFNGCLNKEHESIIYVGDATQQINPGTTGDISTPHKDLSNDRNIRLQKVYRNTKKIIQYIKSLGYPIDIPEAIKDGNPVIEKTFDNDASLTEYVSGLVKNRKEKESLGIVAIDPSSLDVLRDSVKTNDYIHIMTVRESQGLEFDTVCMIDFDKTRYFKNYEKSPIDFQEEKKKIDKDLLYIGLTRAISNLHIACKK